LTKKDFDELFLEAVDDALSSLGDSARQAIYFHLASKCRLEKESIPKNLEEFEGGLERIFGVGAQYIEILIMKRLHEKVGEPLETEGTKDLVFADYVNAAKQSYVKKKVASGKA